MLSWRRWVTVLVGAADGRIEFFKPFNREVIMPVKDVTLHYYFILDFCVYFGLV